MVKCKSKEILYAITTIVVAVVVSLGIRLCLDLGRNKDDVTSEGMQTTTESPHIQSLLYVAPSISKEGHYKNAAVAADAEECSKIGTRIMAVDGGSAIDAAIAALLCVGLYHPHNCGIGGGHFLTYYNRTSGNAYSVIAREQAPSGANQDMFINSSSQTGGKAIGIPGEILGLYQAHMQGGKLPWKQLFAPSIKLCRDGIIVGKHLAKTIEDEMEFYNEHHNLKELVTNPLTGQLCKAGEILRRPKLANTLEIISNEGPDAFYNGSLSANITADIQDVGGTITEGDLANYTALVKDVIKFTTYDNLTVYSPSPPSCGAVYQFILNILNGYKMTADSVSSVDKAVLTYHRITEAFKHAFALRAQLGDNNVGQEAFKAYINDIVKNMTDLTFGEEKRGKIDDTTTFGSAYYNPLFHNVWDHGTAHLSVLAPNGDAVSITSTINLNFGSKVVGSRTGIVFNSQMDDFSTPNTVNYFGVPASPANYIEPWKRPLSSMSPSIVVTPDGQVALNIGAAGGTEIITASALITMESLWFDWGIKESIDYPRIHHQLFPQELQVQETFPQAVIDGLKVLGHNITMRKPGSSIVQGIKQTVDGIISANSDYRKYGSPDGY